MQNGGQEEVYDINYNGTSASELKVLVKQRPNIPAPARKRNLIEVSGRDGELVKFDGTYEDIKISIEFNYITKTGSWAEIYRRAKKWLYSQGNQELSFSDDPEFFYKVKDVEIGANERMSLRTGKFQASFLCEPYQYAASGKREHSVDEVRYNHFEASHPKYLISGTGNCTLTVNGNSVEITVDEHIVLDTEKMLAYKNETLQNTNVSGDYEAMYLTPGTNEIRITDGFTVSIIPNWRCL